MSGAMPGSFLEIFNFSNSYAVFLALGPVATVPLYAAKTHIVHDLSIYLCIYFIKAN